MSIESPLTSFISSGLPGAMVLQGSWGRGKTELWRKVLKQQAANPHAKNQRYAYVSLFGINTLDDLKGAICISAAELIDSDQASDPRSIKERLKSWWREYGVTTKDIANQTADAFAMNVRKIARAYAFYRLHDMLICLDDIERRGEKLDLKDVMGLITLLWEQRGCRVLIILNTQSFDVTDREIWEANKEKVFQGEMVFEPSPEECVALVFGKEPTDVYAVAATGALVELGVTNIRIAQRVRLAIEQVMEKIGETPVSEFTKQRIVRTLVWCIYCHNGRGENAPPLESTSTLIRFVWPLDPTKDARTPQEKAWGNLFERYSPQLDAPLDRVLRELVVKGFGDDAEFTQAVASFERNADAERASNDFLAVWDDVHYGYLLDRQQCLARFRDRFHAAVTVLPSEALDKVLVLLRALGENDLADEFIAAWVNARIGRDRVDELDARAVEDLRAIMDMPFRSAVDKEFDIHRDYMPLAEAMAELRGAPTKLRDKAGDTIAAEGAAELVRYMEANPSRATASAVRVLLTAVDGRGDPLPAKVVAESALTMIARRSPFDAFRIERTYRFRVSSQSEGAFED